MKLERGDYEGASLFAMFDKKINDMTEAEAKLLLLNILHQAMPGATNHRAIYRALARAEATYKEQTQ
jgi:hypothetical protein